MTKKQKRMLRRIALAAGMTLLLAALRPAGLLQLLWLLPEQHSDCQTKLILIQDIHGLRKQLWKLLRFNNIFTKAKRTVNADSPFFINYCSLKRISPVVASMPSTIAKDSNWKPKLRMICPPTWKPFSTAIPIPSTVAPAD